VFTGRYQATHVSSRDRCIATALHAILCLALMINYLPPLKIQLNVYLADHPAVNLYFKKMALTNMRFSKQHENLGSYKKELK
jgi:hypothetical protein